MREKKNINYQNCYVAFLDILGFQLKVMESKNSCDLIRTLFDSLNICAAFPTGGKKISESKGNHRTISVQSRFFSDTIVFFMKDDLDNISQLFFMIRYLQDRLWEKEICLRGALTNGEMYWPDKGENITFGPALINAYKLESELAIYPRILIDKRLYKHIETNKVLAYPFGREGILIDFILKDNDGLYFLDLLNKEIVRFKGEELIQFDKSFSIQWEENTKSNYQCILSKLDTLIEKNCDSKDERIYQKYSWLKNYKESGM